MLVAPVVAAVEFFENDACPDFGDSGGVRAPRKPSFFGLVRCGWRMGGGIEPPLWGGLGHA